MDWAGLLTLRADELISLIEVTPTAIMEQKHRADTVEPLPTVDEPISPKTSRDQVINDADGQRMNGDEETSGLHETPSSSLVGGEDEASRLRALATDVRDQDDLERDVGRQVRSCPWGSYSWLTKL